MRRSKTCIDLNWKNCITSELFSHRMQKCFSVAQSPYTLSYGDCATIGTCTICSRIVVCSSRLWFKCSFDYIWVDIQHHPWICHAPQAVHIGNSNKTGKYQITVWICSSPYGLCRFPHRVVCSLCSGKQGHLSFSLLPSCSQYRRDHLDFSKHRCVCVFVCVCVCVCM